MSQIRDMAERAVEEVVLDRWGDGYAPNWLTVAPEQVVTSDQWLQDSYRMVSTFNVLAEGITNISIGRPERKTFYDQPLAEFVVEIADQAGQVA